MQILLLEVHVGSLKHIGEANINPALVWLHIGELTRQEVERDLVVVQTALKQQTFSDAAREPVMVKLSVG